MVFCCGGLVFFSNGHDLYGFYAKTMRIPLFSGFLTIGGFLLSLKTFILVKLKEDLFDLPAYRKRLEMRRVLNPNLTLYGPLSRLGSFLFWCVLGALTTSVSQFSIGLIEHNYIAAICISLGASTLSVVFIAWWNIHKNLKIWFELLEEDAQKSAI
jgi:hypothetical protein